MKTDKKKLIILIFIILNFFYQCSKKEIVFDFTREIEFSQKKGTSFRIKFGNVDSLKYLGEGWSSPKKNPDGIPYQQAFCPKSKIIFNLIKCQNLKGLINFRPISTPRDSVKEILIKINEHEVKRLKIKRTRQTHYFSVPSQYLKEGENSLEFFYFPAKTDDLRLKFLALTFFDLILTPYFFTDKEKSYLDQIDLYLKKKKWNYFLQETREIINFSLFLPKNSFLDLSYKFFPLTKRVSFLIKIIAENEQGKRKIIYQEIIKDETSLKKIKKDLSFLKKGIYRFSFQISPAEKNSKAKGYIAWISPRILVKSPSQKKEKNHHSFLAQLRKVTQDANVILLVIDAARPDHLSCNGYFRPTTPFLDKIAATGVNFKCAFTEFPGTRGSTATLFTGYSPEVTSLFKIGSRLSPKFTTLAQLFKSKGFYTAGFIANGNVSADFGFQKGFDYYSELHQKEEFSHTAQGFIPFLFPWLEKMKNKKFFLYLHFREPHAPYIPPSPFKGMFSENYQSKIDPNKDKKKINQGKIKIDEQDLNYFIARYDENLASVDSVIGQIIEKMKQLKIYQKTLLIVTSDHGESLSDHHHYFGHGIVLYDEGIRIPLIIHFPNDWLKGKTITSLVKNSDIFPTLAEIYELDIPNEFIDGKSFAPLLYNPDKEINSSIISRTHSSINGYGYSLRTKKYKLIYWLYTWQPPHIEYYDLEKDPYEKVNLFNQGNVVQDFYLTELKKYIKKQRQKRKFLRISPRYIKLKDLDRKTLDNLKALGYI